MLLRNVVGSSVLILALGAVVVCAQAPQPSPEAAATAAQPPAAAAPSASTSPQSAPAVASPTLGPLEAATSSEDEGDVFTETMLTTTIAYLNQSYLSIGILADAVAAEAYEAEQAQELLDAHHSLAEQVETQLRALAKAPGLDQDDVAAVNDLVKLAQLNTWQCETLAAVFEGDASKEKAWEQLREAAMKELEKYGEEETPETAAEPTPTVTK